MCRRPEDSFTAFISLLSGWKISGNRTLSAKLDCLPMEALAIINVISLKGRCMSLTVTGSLKYLMPFHSWGPHLLPGDGLMKKRLIHLWSNFPNLHGFHFPACLRNGSGKKTSRWKRLTGFLKSCPIRCFLPLHRHPLILPTWCGWRSHAVSLSIVQTAGPSALNTMQTRKVMSVR